MKFSFTASALFAAVLASTANAAALAPRQDASSTSSSSSSSGSSSSATGAAASSTSRSSSSSSRSSSSSSSSSSDVLISASAQATPSSVAALVPYGAANLSSTESDTAVGSYGLSNANCTVFQVEIPVNAENIRFSTALKQEYRNQSYVTGQILRYANYQEDYMEENINGTYLNNNSYSINATYCTPITGKKDNSSLITAVHGIGFNSQYWNFAYAPEYSLVKQATSAGYDILIYDRLGTGGSSTPTNGLDEPQAATEVSILAGILERARNGTLVNGTSFDKIVAVGHSYGSIQVQALTAMAPQLLDGAVLTGYSTSTSSIVQFLLGAAFEPAARALPNTFASKPRVWLAAGSNASIVQNFLWPPNYAQGAFDVAYAGGDTVSLGGLFSLSSVTANATDFTGPVFVLTGERDLPFCGNDCTTGNKVASVQDLYPMTSNFTSKLVNETGHGLTVHYTGPQSQRDIVQFFIDNSL